MTAIAPAVTMDQRIIVLRGQRVILDADLAAAYGVTTKRLNEQVKRNRARFPEDFCFRLTADEKSYVVAKCDHLQHLKYSPSLPLAFTEHGAVMVASVLSTATAVAVSVLVVRAFVRLRELAGLHADLSRRLDELEARYDEQFRVVFDAIRALMEPPPAAPHKRIGFEASTKGRP